MVVKFVPSKEPSRTIVQLVTDPVFFAATVHDCTAEVSVTGIAAGVPTPVKVIGPLVVENNEEVNPAATCVATAFWSVITVNWIEAEVLFVRSGVAGFEICTTIVGVAVGVDVIVGVNVGVRVQ